MQKPLHITVIAPYKILPTSSGGQRAIVQLYDHIGQLAPTTLITTAGNVMQKGLHFSLEQLLGRSKFRYINPLLVFAIRKSMRKNSSTVLVISHPYFGWLGILLKWLTGVKLIVQSHNIEAERFRGFGKIWWRVLWLYEKIVHRLADENFFITAEDITYAITKFNIKPKHCHLITYGVALSEQPTEKQISDSKDFLKRKYSIANDEKILLFNGSLDYAPNQQGLCDILDNIIPALVHTDQKFKIIVCGKNLPESFKSRNNFDKIIYAGFVDDISPYFMGADIFLNPINEGGGIKTKLVEALGYNLSSVSTKNGAIGIPENITDGKLSVVDNTNWTAFANAVATTNPGLTIGKRFYQHFNWENIAKDAVHIIESAT